MLTGGQFDFLSLFLFIGVFAVIASVVLALDHMRGKWRKRLKQRLEMVGRGGHGESAPKSAYESIRRKAAARQKKRMDKMLRNMVPSRNALERRLELSGKQISVSRYVVISAALGAVVAAVAGLILSMSPIIAILVGTAAGLTLPHYALKRAIAARKRRFVELLPDAIDLMVRSMKSGLSVTEAINAVGDNIADPLGEAFRQATDSVRLGETMDKALWDVARRVNLPDFNFLVVSLSVQRETGGNLAESLSNLSDILRRRRQVKSKVKALSSEARASTKIIGSLPIFVMAMLYFVSTDYVMKLFTDPRGMILVGIGLGGMVLGMLVMMKMSRFEI